MYTRALTNEFVCGYGECEEEYAANIASYGFARDDVDVGADGVSVMKP